MKEPVTPHGDEWMLEDEAMDERMRQASEDAYWEEMAARYAADMGKEENQSDQWKEDFGGEDDSQ